MRSPAAPALRMYHERVVDHYSNPRNVGFDKSDPHVGTGLVGTPGLGDVMKLQIEVDEETEKLLVLALRPSNGVLL
ncbi:iron-sulfur cluster assembly protein 1 [Phtheirospermum japonicum]|uniref:Iron-sulfur cluster assembly protein 1 n=1 Tax=Phtheirospermum japonicum TaxID=374723 RepID=A0A830B541_9LAMI|nr:iron-sulfur cluster assembly protein 1 [Phtheirospermum japonicum]